MAATRIPVRFPRMAAAFDEGARVRLCESSGSEHSAAAESADLSDLVKSFIEKGDFRSVGVGDGRGEMVNDEKEELLLDDEEAEGYYSDSETKNSLKSLFDKSGCGGGDVKQKVVAAVDAALAVIDDDRSSRGFKRRLMTHLREKGFDAGLCKAKWVKSSRFPAGDYEFVDVNINGIRYIVEPFFVGEFEIARPTARYTSLLNVFPTTFVGEVEELKKIVRLMCTAIKKSMKSIDMSTPPWRRNAYMQAKWFGSYKRTTSAKPAKEMLEVNNEGFGGVKRSLGFDTLPTKSYYCRDAFACNNGLRVSHLTAAFQGI